MGARVFLVVALVAMVSKARVLTVPEGGDIATVLAQAMPTDEVVLAAASYVLPASLQLGDGIILRGVANATVLRTTVGVNIPLVIVSAAALQVQLQGLVFDGSSTDAQALDIGNGAEVTVTDCEFSGFTKVFTVRMGESSLARFERCRFANNHIQITDAGGGVIGGGAISANEANGAQLTVSQCEFVSNSFEVTELRQLGGGAISITGGADTEKLIMSDSLFVDNSAIGPVAGCSSENSGGAVRAGFSTVGTGSVTRATRCIFRGNSLTGCIRRGSAFHSRARDQVLVDTCLFINNGLGTVDAGGAFYTSPLGTSGSSFALLRDVTWRENRAAGEATDISIGEVNGATSTVECVNCLFAGESTTHHIQLGRSGSRNSTLLGENITFGSARSRKISIGIDMGGHLAVNVSLGAGSGNGVQGQPALCSFDRMQSSLCSLFVSAPAMPPADTLMTAADNLRVGLQSVQSPNSPPLSITSDTTFVGSLTVLPNSTLQVAAGALLTVTGSVTILDDANLVLSGVTSAGDYEILRAQETLSYSRAANVNVVTTFPACQQASGVSSQQQGLSVIVSVGRVDDTCGGTTSNGGGLSTGALIGIIVGAVVGGILVALFIILLTCWLTRRRTEAANKQIMRKDIEMR